MKTTMKRTLAALAAIGLVWTVQAARAEILFNGMVPASTDDDPATPDYQVYCDGLLVDEVDFTGELHFLAVLTTDAKGKLHLKVQLNPRGVTGVGRMTGDTYQGVGITVWENDILRPDGSARDTYVNQFGLVARATGLKYFMHQVTHLFFDENGNLKVAVELNNITCR